MTVGPEVRTGEASDTGAAAETGHALVLAAASRRAARATWWGLAVLLVLALAAAGLAAGLFFVQHRTDDKTDAAAAAVVLEAAKVGTTAVLSYAPATVDDDLKEATSHLTGHFLEYYSEFSEQIMASAIKQRGVHASVDVVQAAVSELDPNSAVVLLFINQTTASKENPAPAQTTNSVRVTLSNVDGSWLISQLEPQ